MKVAKNVLIVVRFIIALAITVGVYGFMPADISAQTVPVPRPGATPRPPAIKMCDVTRTVGATKLGYTMDPGTKPGSVPGHRVAAYSIPANSWGHSIVDATPWNPGNAELARVWGVGFPRTTAGFMFSTNWGKLRFTVKERC